MIEIYETAVNDALANLSTTGIDKALQIAKWPDSIRGYGPVKAESMQQARTELARIVNMSDGEASQKVVA